MAGQVQKRREAARPKVTREALVVDLDPEGWTRCPACNRRLSVANSEVFKEGRHRCGQGLTILSTFTFYSSYAKAWYAFQETRVSFTRRAK